MANEAVRARVPSDRSHVMSHLAQGQPRAGNYTSQLFAVGVHGKAAAIDAHLKPVAFARRAHLDSDACCDKRLGKSPACRRLYNAPVKQQIRRRRLLYKPVVNSYRMPRGDALGRAAQPIECQTVAQSDPNTRGA